MLLTDLPIDVVVIIFPYLNAKDFLAFTSCSRSLLPYRQEPAFWRDLTRSTFRIPPQPLLEADGARWQRLYKNLRSQTHVYTWGSNARGNLGHFRRSGGRQLHSTRTTGNPKEMVETEPVGVVADVQCGGWSTVLLNSIGQLWAVGVANGLMDQSIQPILSPLTFPNGYPPTTSNRHEPSTAMQQYSVGRCKVLGLSDDHRIWEWNDFRRPGQFVRFFGLDTNADQISKIGKVTKVVSGWSKSSAYVLGTGIIYWGESAEVNEEAMTDGFIVEHRIVPGTAYQRNQPSLPPVDTMDISIGEVVNYIFLEKFIVFTTHLNKLFAWKASDEFNPGTAPIELSSFYRGTHSKIQDIQGSFRNFGVFTTDGAVMIGSKDMLNAQWGEQAPSPGAEFPDVPSALQNAQVISLAFGDYHFHALHANGTITSYGTESQGCGALGLGGPNVSPLRGTFFTRRTTGDGRLQVPSWGDGRRTVWFEAEKRRWISDTCQKEATSEASPRAVRLREDVETAKLIGEWFEREGRNWSAGPSGDLAPVKQNQDDDDDIGEDDDSIDAYFALKVSAAGWSSAALVLVNETKAERVRRKYLVAEAPSTGENGGTGEPSTSCHLPRPSVTLGNSQQGDSGLSSALSSFGRSLIGFVPGASSLFGTSSISDSFHALGPALPVPRHYPEATPAAAGANVIALPPSITQAPAPARNAVPDPARGASSHRRDVYVWEDQPFPRLRYPDGTVMPGDVPLTAWKGGEPDFGRIVGADVG